MNYLEKRIIEEGVVINEDVLKVGSFLNQQVDPKLMKLIGKSFAKHFKEKNVTKVLTIEVSGISPAIYTAEELDVNMLILKKDRSKTVTNAYVTTVHSFTKDIDYDLVMPKDYINSNDRVLIIDDFLAMGEAAQGAIRLAREAGATVVGVGSVIEKSFQPGRKKLEDDNIEVYSVARIESLKDNNIKFVDKNEVKYEKHNTKRR